MSEFKIGLKVRIIANTNCSYNEVGDIGVIVEGPRSNGSYRVQVEGRPTLGNWTRPADMELVDEKQDEPTRKKKILYPVGTKGRNEYGEFEVIGYTKGGVTAPYAIQYKTRVGVYRKSLAEMKEFEYEGVDSHPEPAVETARPQEVQKSISTEDVAKLLADQEDRIVRRVRAEVEAEVKHQLEVTRKEVAVVTVAKVPQKEKDHMSLGGNIRQKINRLTMSHEDRQLQKYEITSEFGNLTDLGRRVVLDKLFQADADLRKAIVDDLDAVEKEEAKARK